jgi:hypothetical protein
VNRNGEKPECPRFGLKPGWAIEDYESEIEGYLRATQTESERVGYLAEFYGVTRETVRCWIAENCNIFRIDLTHEFAQWKKSRRRSNRFDTTKRHRIAPRSPL